LQRLPFHPQAPFGLKFQNWSRARAKSAVIQENNFPIKQPELRIGRRTAQGSFNRIHPLKITQPGLDENNSNCFSNSRPLPVARSNAFRNWQV
jgi:hypothetical protein